MIAEYFILWFYLIFEKYISINFTTFVLGILFTSIMNMFSIDYLIGLYKSNIYLKITSFF
jgi:hypothetical protein